MLECKTNLKSLEEIAKKMKDAGFQLEKYLRAENIGDKESNIKFVDRKDKTLVQFRYSKCCNANWILFAVHNENLGWVHGLVCSKCNLPCNEDIFILKEADL